MVAFMDYDSTAAVHRVYASANSRSITVTVATAASFFVDRAFLRDLERCTPERLARAKESLEIAAALEPKPLRFSVIPRIGRSRMPRCSPPARFGYYQGDF